MKGANVKEESQLPILQVILQLLAIAELVLHHIDKLGQIASSWHTTPPESS